ncbi:MAG TPA: AMP-binding protein [Chlamydiales bacterium]|nr:AMP-binding protein [Chlamydiales bacterium]
MSYYFWMGVSYCLRALLSLRYKVTIEGLEQLDPERLQGKEGILFLPNHPAHMDPFMIFIWLWPKFRMRPLAIEYIYRHPLLHPFIRMVGSLPVPNFGTGINQLKIKKAQESVQLIAAGLKKKENFILWPAGRLKSSGKEVLGGASSAHALIQECPDANVVLIRTSGLWGSSFSRALTGRSPEPAKTFLNGIKYIFTNLIFFTPRRKVYIQIASNPEGLPRSGERLDFNRFLESWYNQYRDDEGNVHEVEPLKLIPYSRWNPKLPEVYQPKKKSAAEGEIPEKIREKVVQEIQRILDKPNLEIKPEMNLAMDLGMDSLNIAEMIAFISHNYDVGEVHPDEMETVQSVLELAAGVRVSDDSDREVSQFTWPEESHRPPPSLPEGKTFIEVFFNACARMSSSAACGDDVVGVLSYSRLKLAVLVLSQYFRTLPEQHIAILLPSSVGAYVAILAIQCAGKVPVMLNWTLGPRYLEEMMKTSGAKRVISSWKFLDRVSNVDFGKLSDQFELLEDIRKNLKLPMKLKGAFLARCSPSFILRSLKLKKLNENSPAVILFTSGTEASPKGVPLTHKNILTNQSSTLQCIHLKKTDVVYGILPPFHSFGFSVAGTLPLFAGVRVAYYPDPTDSFALAEGIERWKITLFLSPPSFLKGLFHAAKDKQLRTVRYFVTGAEKASPELIKKSEKLGAKFIEGYGITECSPVLALTRINLPPKGVGQLLPDVEAITIHPETLELLPKGKEGELCFRGPNVFHGYLGNPRDPFIEIEGKKWYRSGDIGYFDSQGNLILSGRLKRFTKVGGEMISLGAVEEVLIQEFSKRGQVQSDLPTIAVIADERNPDKSQLILFTTLDLTQEMANEILSHSGFSRLIKIASVQKVEEIPMMGTGKTDYRRLQSLLK